MASSWFVRQAGKVYGPFDSTRLRKLAAAGKLFRDSGIAKQQGGPWTQASRVRGLFQDESPPDCGNELRVDDAASGTVSKRRGWLRKPPPVPGLPERPPGDSLWFYRDIAKDDETARGPCSAAEMARLVEKGEVRASTLVLQRGDTRWETAFSAGLFLDSPRGGTDETDGSGEPPPLPQPNESLREEILWTGRPSHHANYGSYLLSFLAAPFIFPAVWGLKKYLSRDCLRYQITSRRVRFKHGGDAFGCKEILLRDIRDAAFVSPLALQATKLCDIYLYGDNTDKPLGVLEGISLTESALVISLCEAAAHRHIPTRAKERLLADTRAQEQELLRRAEQRHQREMDALRAQVQLDRQQQDSVFAVPQASWPTFIPPPPPTRKQQHVSGLTGWIWGGSQRRTVWVKGHYRGRKWIKPHRRRL